MSIGFWQIVIIVLLLVLLFGRGKISDLMGDVAQGIKSFKKGLNEDTDEEVVETPDSPKVIEHAQAEPVSAPAPAKPRKAAAMTKAAAKTAKPAARPRAKTGGKRTAG